MNILVTGATGLLGVDLVPVLEENHRIYKYGIHNLDIVDPGMVREIIHKRNPDLIIHGAAYTDVDGCESNPGKTFQVNGLGTKNVVEAGSQKEIPVLYISTDYVFNGKKTVPYRETDPVDPLNVYGMSKLMGERYILKSTLKYYIIRTSWLYGRGGKNFVDTIIGKAKTENELKVVNDQVGSPTWSMELSKAIAELIKYPNYGIYHITNSGQCSWYEFAMEILKNIGNENVKVIPVDSKELNRPARRPAYSKLDTAAFENTTGLKLDSWQKALKTYLESKNIQRKE